MRLSLEGADVAAMLGVGLLEGEMASWVKTGEISVTRLESGLSNSDAKLQESERTKTKRENPVIMFFTIISIA